MEYTLENGYMPHHMQVHVALTCHQKHQKTKVVYKMAKHMIISWGHCIVITLYMLTSRLHHWSEGN